MKFSATRLNAQSSLRCMLCIQALKKNFPCQHCINFFYKLRIFIIFFRNTLQNIFISDTINTIRSCFN